MASSLSKAPSSSGATSSSAYTIVDSINRPSTGRIAARCCLERITKWQIATLLASCMASASSL